MARKSLMARILVMAEEMDDQELAISISKGCEMTEKIVHRQH